MSCAILRSKYLIVYLAVVPNEFRLGINVSNTKFIWCDSQFWTNFVENGFRVPLVFCAAEFSYGHERGFSTRTVVIPKLNELVGDNLNTCCLWQIGKYLSEYICNQQVRILDVFSYACWLSQGSCEYLDHFLNKIWRYFAPWEICIQAKVWHCNSL
jgi:hypothetical protein